MNAKILHSLVSPNILTGYLIIRTTNSQIVLVTPTVVRSLIHIASTTNPLPGKENSRGLSSPRKVVPSFYFAYEKTSNVVVNDTAAEGYSKRTTQLNACNRNLLAATLYAKHCTSYQAEKGKFVSLMITSCMRKKKDDLWYPIKTSEQLEIKTDECVFIY